MIAGLTPALFGSGVAWGLYFFSYNRAKDRHQRRTGQDRLPPPLHLASAAEAGVVVCLATNPIWVVKTRLQLQRTGLGASAALPAAAGAANYRGFLDCLFQVARKEGLGGLYKGLLPSLLLVSRKR